MIHGVDVPFALSVLTFAIKIQIETLIRIGEWNIGILISDDIVEQADVDQTHLRAGGVDGHVNPHLGVDGDTV